MDTIRLSAKIHNDNAAIPVGASLPRISGFGGNQLADRQQRNRRGLSPARF